jgi:hypothetical protein
MVGASQWNCARCSVHLRNRFYHGSGMDDPRDTEIKPRICESAYNGVACTHKFMQWIDHMTLSYTRPRVHTWKLLENLILEIEIRKETNKDEREKEILSVRIIFLLRRLFIICWWDDWTMNYEGHMWKEEIVTELSLWGTAPSQRSWSPAIDLKTHPPPRHRLYQLHQVLNTVFSWLNLYVFALLTQTVIYRQNLVVITGICCDEQKTCPESLLRSCVIKYRSQNPRFTNELYTMKRLKWPVTPCLFFLRGCIG